MRLTLLRVQPEFKVIEKIPDQYGIRCNIYPPNYYYILLNYIIISIFSDMLISVLRNTSQRKISVCHFDTTKSRGYIILGQMETIILF